MVAALLARLLSQSVTSKVTGGEGIFSLLPSEWQEVCQTDASFPFLVNAVFLVLYTLMAYVEECMATKDAQKDR